MKMSHMSTYTASHWLNGSPSFPDNFVACKISLIHVESLICALPCPALNEFNEPIPILALPSRAGPLLGLGPSWAGLTHFAKPGLSKCSLKCVMFSVRILLQK